ncbi:MAG: PEP-CTERM sorting domain-containing protein [Candidatus Omnitrophota bacterium]
MKHIFVILVAAGVLLSPCAAKADWTDDFSGTAMSGIWFSESSVNTGDLSQDGGTNGVLNFTSGGTYADWAAYGSAFSFGLENDFSAKVDYGFAWAPGGQQGAQAGILMRMTGQDGNGTPSFYGTLSTGYLSDHGYYNAIGHNDVFNIYGDNYEGLGWFGLMYDSGDDILYAGIFRQGETTPFYGEQIGNFSGLVGDGGSVKFSLEGWANYACVGEGQAALDNFNASAAPEPVSTALFLIGGATLAARRLRRK